MILSEIISNNNYTLYNNITLDSRLIFEKCLGHDLYVTYQGLLDDKKVVIKLYIWDLSDENNEIPVLDYLQANSSEFPIPYLSISYPNLNIVDDISKIIVYEYIEGESITSSNIDMSLLKEDIEKQLNILHKLNLVFADIRIENIIKLPNNKYFLIDYGRVFSTTDKNLPPMEFMIDYDEIPSQQDDFDALKRIIQK